MCNLETEPWRKDFTGPLCKCGVPMPGNAQEQAIQDEQDTIARRKWVDAEKAKMRAYYEERFRQINLNIVNGLL